MKQYAVYMIEKDIELEIVIAESEAEAAAIAHEYSRNFGRKSNVEYYVEEEGDIDEADGSDKYEPGFDSCLTNSENRPLPTPSTYIYDNVEVLIF